MLYNSQPTIQAYKRACEGVHRSEAKIRKATILGGFLIRKWISAMFIFMAASARNTDTKWLAREILG